MVWAAEWRKGLEMDLKIFLGGVNGFREAEVSAKLAGEGYGTHPRPPLFPFALALRTVVRG